MISVPYHIHPEAWDPLTSDQKKALTPLITSEWIRVLNGRGERVLIHRDSIQEVKLDLQITVWTEKQVYFL